MRTLTAALIAASLTLAAQPSFAGETALGDSQAKIDRILGHSTQSYAYASRTAPAVTASTTIKNARAAPMNRYERAHHRLFKFRSGPSGR